MSEEAPSAPEETPEQPASEFEETDGGRGFGGGRGCLPILIGVFLLLAGTFIGKYLAERLPSEDAASPSTEPVPVTQPSDSDLASAIARANRPPVELHYLIVCGAARQVGPRLDLLGVVAELRTAALPSKGELTIALAISAANRDRRFAVRGFYADGHPFMEEELELHPADPRQPYPNTIRVPVELTTPEPLVIEVFTDDKYLLGRRVVPVRVRPATRPATAPSSDASGEPSDEPPDDRADESPPQPSGGGPGEPASEAAPEN